MWWLLACGFPSTTEEPALEEVRPAPARSGPVVIVGEPLSGEDTPAEGLPGSSPPTTLQLRFEGVSRLHQGYFSAPVLLRKLAEGLAGCVGTVDVEIAYDTPKRLGTITMAVEPEELFCKPEREASGINLRPLEPLGRALASYRSSVASSYDVRVATFEVWLRTRGGEVSCGLKLAGQYPPDGSTWSPCVEVGQSGPRCTSRDNLGVDVLPVTGEGTVDYGVSCWGG